MINYCYFMKWALFCRKKNRYSDNNPEKTAVDKYKFL